nr:hypothetical protein [Nitrosomonas nitrosa]
MTWPEQWRALAARIDGLLHAAEFLTATFGVRTSDDSGVIRKSFQPVLEAITTDLNKLRSTYAHELPPSASDAVRKFVELRAHEGITGDPVHIQRFAHLASLRSELEYLLHDVEAGRRSFTELAFEHLRRQLVVDKEIRKKWETAFKKREEACEALGAIHLLSHGIWAFKIDALGGATDLVFSHPVEQYGKLIRRTARALVLTEWKLVKHVTDMEGKAQEAREQTEIYSGGVLGDVELKQTRYIILVSESDLNPPEDLTDKGITYHHINLPVNPDVPSRTARRRKKPKPRKSEV